MIPVPSRAAPLRRPGSDVRLQVRRRGLLRRRMYMCVRVPTHTCTCMCMHARYDDEGSSAAINAEILSRPGAGTGGRAAHARRDTAARRRQRHRAHVLLHALPRARTPRPAVESDGGLPLGAARVRGRSPGPRAPRAQLQVLRPADDARRLRRVQPDGRPARLAREDVCRAVLPVVVQRAAGAVASCVVKKCVRPGILRSVRSVCRQKNGISIVTTNS